MVSIEKTPNWKDLKLERQCGVCAHYIQFIKKGKYTARGNCARTKVYKMRTETCNKFQSLKIKED